MSEIDQDYGVTAHLIEVEPVALFGLTLTEIRYLMTVSVGIWFAVFALLLLPIKLILIVVALPLSALFGLLTTWLIGKRIKKMKVGKPHHFYIHYLQRRWLYGVGFSPFPTHTGQYRLGRTAEAPNNAPQKQPGKRS